MVFIVGLILFNTIINAREKFHDARFWTYESPNGFSRDVFVARADSSGNATITLTGALGGLTSFWSTMTVTVFSMIGMDVILYTAPENQDLRRDETIKLATRKLSMRVILLYVLAVFTVGLNVPYGDKQLDDSTLLGVQGGQNSAFIIACIREHVTGLPHLFNGFFIFSAASCGINCLYASSRALHALASIPAAWPEGEFFQETVRGRLARTRMGVPMNAVFVSWLITLLAFLSVRTTQWRILGQMTTVAVVSNLLVYGINCVAYLNFYRLVNAAARGRLDDELNLTPETRTHYDRNAPRYPYRTHLQWIRAVYALVGCTILLIFHGWRTLLSPVIVDDFVASYIPIVLFLALTCAYYVRDHGFHWRYWKRFAAGLVGLDIVGPILVSEDSFTRRCSFCGGKHRKGHLRWPDRKPMLTRRNFKAFVEWLWVWTE
jgi:amino acid transporter